MPASLPDLSQVGNAWVSEMAAIGAISPPPAVANDPYVAAFKGQPARVKAVPKVPEWERIVTEMQIVAERMVRGEYTPAPPPPRSTAAPTACWRSAAG